MFGKEGAARSERQNRFVAAFLASVGGFVNSAGFVLIGSFTSHVTGNVGRLANDVASAQTGAAATALVMILAFVTGAFVASMCIESDFFVHRQRSYAAALSCEAVLLITFTWISTLTAAGHPRLQDMEAALLCCAMGMQNSLVTRLSGAVVRTTHLTGVFTDIGIESARWFRWWRGRLSKTLRLRLAFGRNPSEMPSSAKIALLGTIAIAFTLGALLGSVLAIFFGHAAMICPSVAVSAAATYAFAAGAKSGRDSIAPGPETRR